jgi:hypothetical protein
MADPNALLQSFLNAANTAMPVDSYNRGVETRNLLEQQLLQNQQMKLRNQLTEQMTPLEIAAQEEANRYALATNNLREQVLGQQVQGGQMELDDATRARLGKDLTNLGQSALLIPKGSRKSFVLDRLKTVDFAGLNEGELIDEISGMDEDQLDTYLQKTFSGIGKKGADLIPSSGRLIEVDGKKFMEFTVANPDGTVRTVRDPVGGEILGKTTGLTPEQQAQLDILSAGGKQTAENISDLQYKPEIAGEVKAKEEKAKIIEQERADIIDKGYVAQSSLGTIERALELNKKIKTGGFAQAMKQMQDYLGTTSRDEGVLMQSLNALVLDNAKALGSNPTEGERAFLLNAQASYGQGAESNIAILENMQKVAKRQVERARWIAKNPGKGKADWLQEFGDFEPEKTKTMQSGTMTLPSGKTVTIRQK